RPGERSLAPPSQHLHAEGLAVAGDDGTDPAVAVDAKRLPAQARPDGVRLPLPRTERSNLLSDAAQRGDDEPPGQLGRGVGRPAWRHVGRHDHAGPRAWL